jgi:hypothetical protein
MSNPLAEQISALFLEHSVRKLEQMQSYTHACFDRLTEEQVWHRGGEHENALGNLILHLCGNMRQWILFGVAKQPDVRMRDAEFATGGDMTREHLLALFDGTLAECSAVIANLPAERLTERTNPQHGEVSVLDAIYQVVGHVQQHVGQIIWATKRMVGTDLDLSMPRAR